jgi:hypothetical protein
LIPWGERVCTATKVKFVDDPNYPFGVKMNILEWEEFDPFTAEQGYSIVTDYKGMTLEIVRVCPRSWNVLLNGEFKANHTYLRSIFLKYNLVNKILPQYVERGIFDQSY